MPSLTINEAATTTGWSPRMLRYVEQLGLLDTPRSDAGYRLYGPAELQRLRTLRELLDTYGLELGDVGFALRLRREPELAAGARRPGSRPSRTARSRRPRRRHRPPARRPRLAALRAGQAPAAAPALTRHHLSEP